MSIKLSVPQAQELKPRITVFGVGGAGGNAVNNMIEAGLEGVEFVVANTDAQALALSSADRRIQLGASITEGLGAGSRPEVGCAAAEEALHEIAEHLQGAHMVFITAGMGGGTGTGASPVVADIAKRLGALTVAVVTKPFFYEGRQRMKNAEEGIEELQRNVDTLIVIPNDRIGLVVDKGTPLLTAFSVANNVLKHAVQGIADLVLVPGLVNLDFADVRTVMETSGRAVIGMGTAKGESRGLEAAKKAISNPLLENSSIDGARGILINVTGGLDLTHDDMMEASSLIYDSADRNANIIIGSVINPDMEDEVRVTVIATGFPPDVPAEKKPEPARALKKWVPQAISLRVSERILSKTLINISSAEPLPDGMPYEEPLDIPTFLRRTQMEL
ncbi:MAG: cell division protein FtsZ [Parvibaculum sp.]|uniref:cell division protein FtsZ n=1 Tax=Parvibaculum sp. TaxID=2024848 RepID=UPI002730A9C5|nr:cell division protein FtsZ [Parvibaculum sp.]MDP2151624.1 cell division protein FtsZ [Parvibaculum sp.]